MNNDEINEFNNDFKDVTLNSAEKMKKSHCYLAVLNPSLRDPIQLIQIGLAVCMDKPIYFIIEKGMPLPRHLARIASGYEFAEPNDINDYKRAVEQLMKKMYENEEIKKP